jgi:hypothetical protein
MERPLIILKHTHSALTLITHSRPVSVVYSYLREPEDLSQYRDGLWAMRRGSIPGKGKRFSTLPKSASRPTQPPIQWVPGLYFRGSSGRGMKLITHLHLGRSQEWWSSTPSYVFIPRCLIKHRDNFTFSSRFQRVLTMVYSYKTRDYWVFGLVHRPVF